MAVTKLIAKRLSGISIHCHVVVGAGGLKGIGQSDGQRDNALAYPGCDRCGMGGILGWYGLHPHVGGGHINRTGADIPQN